MTGYQIAKIDNANAGISREWSLCNFYGTTRTKHDHARYDQDSDLNIADKHISIKASGFSLMSGSLCEGKQTFDEIWGVFERNVHSNIFAYVTADYTVYEMNIQEFKKFVYAFCGLERESQENGGQLKIRCRKESKKMLKWLAEQ